MDSDVENADTKVDVVEALRETLAGMEERLRQRIAEEQQATANRLIQEGAVGALRYVLNMLGAGGE